MDRGQIAELKAWAERLGRRAADGELKAASRAILLLAAEVERLHRESETARAAPEAAGDGELEQLAAPADADEWRLRARLKRAFGYGP